MMNDSEQITLYSCHLCGFCETSLSALTKHTASHIKNEHPSDHVPGSSATDRRDWRRASVIPESQRDDDGRVSMETDNTDVVFVESQVRDEHGRNRENRHTINSTVSMLTTRQQQSGTPVSNRGRRRTVDDDDDEDDDDDVIVLEESLRSPQIGDVFPSNSYPVTTQSRVMFPSGWNEAPPQRTTTIRMPNDPYRNIHQSKSASLQEANETRLPRIINCTTVRPSTGQPGMVISREADFSRTERYRPPSRSDNNSNSSIQEENFVQYYHDDQTTERRFSDSRNSSRSSGSQNQSRYQNNFSYMNSTSSPFVQYNFHRVPRAKESRSSSNNNLQNFPQVRDRPMNRELSNSRHLSSHNSAFSSFNGHNNSYRQHNDISSQQESSRKRNYPKTDRQRYQRDSESQMYSRQQNNIVPSNSDPVFNGTNRIACPIPLPNNGTYIPNQNQPIVLPNSWYRDNVSGFIVVPIKHTSDVAIQTDESCLSLDYIQYHPVTGNAVPTNSQINDGRGINTVGNEMDGDSTVTHADVSRRTFNCHVCNKEFLSELRMKAHFEEFHSTSSLKCSDCGREFQSAKNMQLHRARVHNKRMPFRCGVCGLRFEDRSSVVQHLATHNATEKTANCGTCGKRFRSEEKLKKHMLKHKDMWHKCAECDKRFGSVATLQYHLAQVHKRHQPPGENTHESGIINVPADGYQLNPDMREPPVESGRSLQSTSEPALYACRYCQTTFTDPSELNRHLEECSLSEGQASGKMFRCAACPTFFATKPELVNHYNTTHLTRDGYICSKCPRKFRLWSKLKMHIKAFHGLKKTALLKFPCKVCPNKFSSRLKLDDHMKKVHQMTVKHERIYTCKECKKRFRNLSSLMVHRRGVHALNILESPSTQTWECPHCNIDRLTRKTYIAHLKEVHKLLVAEKGRSLEIIGKDTSAVEQTSDSGVEVSVLSDNATSTTSSAVVASASGVPLPKIFCEECGAAFVEEKRLKNHLGLVHGQRPFSCEICDRKFSYSGQLMWHMKDHGDKDARQATGTKSDDVNNELFENTEDAARPSVEGESSAKQIKRSQTELLACEHCLMRFSDEKRLNNHLGVRHGYKNFNCDLCDEKFSYSTHLIWHKRSHITDKKKDSTNSLTEQGENLINDLATDQLSIIENEAVVKDGEIHSSEAMNCQYCYESFGDEEALKIHLRTHEGEATIQVDKEQDIGIGRTVEGDGMEKRIAEGETDQAKATESNADASVLNEHQTKTLEKQINRYVCGQCEADFSGQDLLKEHMMKSHNASILNNSTEKTAEVPSVNKDNHIPNNGFNCEICNKLLGTYIGWKVHRTRVHRLSDDKTESQAAAMSYALQNYPTAMPPEFDAGYANQRELGSEDLSSSAVYSCSKCSRIFTGLRNLRTHQFKMHSIRVKERGSRESMTFEPELTDTPLYAKVQEGHIFPCGTCDYQFSSEKGRRIHCKKMMHSEHKPANSGTENPTKESSSEHGNETTDDGSPDFKKAKLDDDMDSVISPCEICDIEFSNFRELKQHFQEKHPEEIAFETPDKEFVNSRTWDQDNLSKSAPPVLGQLTLDCPKCDRSFPTRKGLNTHLVKLHKIKGTAFAKWTQKFGLSSDVKSQDETVLMPDDGSNQHLSLSASALTSPGHERPSGNASFLPTMVENVVGQHDNNVVARRVCSICQRSFHNRRGLTMHMARYHHLNKAELRKFNIDLDLVAESEMSSTENADIDKLVKSAEKPSALTEACPLCPLTFPSRRSLGTHIFKRHGIRCKRLSPAERRALFSMNKQTTSDGSQDSSNKEYLFAIDCPICSGKFVGKRGVRAHVSRIHSLDKVELGFLFPDKYETHDNVSKACKECNRVFGNIRIYAAHLYFVHKKEKDEADQADNTGKESTSVYRCSDLQCEETFRTALELLIHIRAKNGRRIDDVDVEVINPDPALIGEEVNDVIDDDDFDDDDDDGDVVVNVDAVEDSDIDGNIYRGMDNHSTKEVSRSLAPVGFFACFICKKEFGDEATFRSHYEKAHANVASNDAENLRDIIERNKLQTDAISKEYSLRATASRKAFRSEIEFSEHYISVPKLGRDDDQKEVEIASRGRINMAIDHGEIDLASAEVVAENANNCFEDSESHQIFENDGTKGKQMQSEDESCQASKKNFFAAALDLQVTP